MLYNTGGIWSKTVTPVLTAGKDLTAAWDAFGTQLVNEAKTFGYEVVDTGTDPIAAPPPSGTRDTD